jgi:hypothetical protein
LEVRRPIRITAVTYNKVIKRVPAWWLRPVILATHRKEEIRQVTLHSQPVPPKQNVSEIPIPTTKTGMVECACNPSYVGGISRRIMVQGQPQAKI